MGKLSELFRTFGPEYLTTYGADIPAGHRKALQALMACRTDACGLVGYTCTQCGEPHWTFRSCGNRHCPQCQHHKSRLWLTRRLAGALPGHHFLLTFTVPEALRPFLRSHQRAAYGALFTASADAIKTLARDAKYLGGDLPGFFGVLHTWGRQLMYHPHIHYVVPGGAFSTQDETWHPSRIDFYLPVKALSQIYRAKFRDAMHQLGLFEAIPAAVWTVDWNVHCQAVGASEASLTYLAPYVFRVAISESRILRVQDRTVWFHYRKPHSRRLRTLALDVLEFIRRFLQHVLPTGFMKVRYYGFMHANCAIPRQRLVALIELASGSRSPPSPPWSPSRPRPCCARIAADASSTAGRCGPARGPRKITESRSYREDFRPASEPRSLDRGVTWSTLGTSEGPQSCANCHG